MLKRNFFSLFFIFLFFRFFAFQFVIMLLLFLHICVCFIPFLLLRFSYINHNFSMHLILCDNFIMKIMQTFALSFLLSMEIFLESFARSIANFTWNDYKTEEKNTTHTHILRWGNQWKVNS